MTTKRKNQSKSSKEIRNPFLKHFSRITAERLVYITFGIYLFATLLVYTVIPEVFQPINILLKLLKYFCYVVFLYKACIDIKRDRRISLSIVIFAILSILSFIFSQNRILLIFFCILVGLRKMNIRKLIKIAYYVSITIFLLTISLSLLGVIPNWTFFTRGTTVARNALGFIYATDCIGVYLSIILMFFYLKRSDARIFEIILLEMLNLFLYKATDGRLSFILITLLLTILIISKIARIDIKNTSQRLRQMISQNHFVRTVIKAACYILPITTFIAYNSLTFAYMNNPASMEKVDHLLSSRLELTAQAYEKYHMPLFGKDITWQGLGGYGYIDEIDVENFEYNFIDSSYARLIFDFGIVYTLAILIAYTYSMTYYLKKKDYWALLVIIFILIWSFIEPYLADMTRNPLVLLLIPTLSWGPTYIFKNKKSAGNNQPSLKS